MRIKKINKNTMFVKIHKKDYTNGDSYLVEEKENDGIVTISVTKDPLKAKLYTAAEVYKYVYEKLTDSDKKDIMETYEKNESYEILSRLVNDRFSVIETGEINYGYSNGDIEDEKQLLNTLDLVYILKDLETKKTIVKDID